eukprot:CAMPEP_0194327238 /NCGR_PEP_ID=MMETSP0171-20130528/40226_1 /TAXON_ID=218684 /ORGANISM="Corethron pennatum, Strain L29A3" /LENGTH=226 /DNA_ID=CAMNT_0039087119 /DNA_START=67 /DNA_END=748 /DNA_ORIENTATION=-
MRESSNDDQIQDFTPSPSLDAGVLLEAARRDKLALMNISNIQYDTPEKKTNGLVASQPISPQSVAVDLFKIDTIHKDTSVADMSIDEPQIQIDAANDNVALAVFATLTFFCFLFGGTVALCIVSVSNYGLVAFTAMGAVMVILGSAMHCFWSVAKSDPQLRPVRNRIERSLVVAQAVIINEIQAFQEEMNEHGLLLLENGSASDYVECEDAAKDDPRAASNTGAKI